MPGQMQVTIYEMWINPITGFVNVYGRAKFLDTNYEVSQYFMEWPRPLDPGTKAKDLARLFANEICSFQQANNLIRARSDVNVRKGSRVYKVQLDDKLESESFGWMKGYAAVFDESGANLASFTVNVAAKDVYTWLTAGMDIPGKLAELAIQQWTLKQDWLMGYLETPLTVTPDCPLPSDPYTRSAREITRQELEEPEKQTAAR